MSTNDSSLSSEFKPRRSWAVAAFVALQPIAISITQPVVFYAQNVGEVDLADGYRSLLLAGGTSLAVWALASAGLRDVRRGALFASLVAFLFWSTTTIEGGAAVLGGEALSSIVVGGFWIVGVPLVLVWLARSRRSLSSLSLVFDIVAAAGLALPLAGIAIANGGIPSSDSADANSQQTRPETDSGERPDIYLIVLDAHARDDELAEHFGIDAGLGDELEKLGFYVARESHTNYSSTLHALPSLLNFNFVRHLVRKANRSNLTNLVCRNRFVRILRDHGYRFISYASGIPLSECENADVYIEPPSANQLLGMNFSPNYFERGLLLWTPFAAVLRRPGGLSMYAQHRERILHAISDLPRHVENSDPTFVFAHILSPHEPFVFGENGEDVSPSGMDYHLNRIFKDPDQPVEPGRVGPEYARRYRAQTLYLDKLVLQAVEEILRRSSEPPIILIQGDHGPYGFSPNIRHPRFPILNAYYPPNGGERELYPSITPVNSLRVILNHYFDLQLRILTDKSYRTSWIKPNVYTAVDTHSLSTP